MRAETNKAKLATFMTALGARVRGPGRIYLTGGATAILYGWREMTIDVDLKPAPEPAGLFEAIRPQLIRYPAVDPASFERAVAEFCDANR